jgi:hypothetical protein
LTHGTFEGSVCPACSSPPVPGALTMNERSIALAAWASADHWAGLPAAARTDARKWGNLVLEAHDALALEVVRLRAQAAA